jgi:hypothetical protein
MKLWITLFFIFICSHYENSVGIVSNDEIYTRKIINSFLDGPKKQLFKVYHFLLNKEYDLNSEEGIRRYNIFKQNLKFHKDHNSTPGVTFQIGIGPFTDLTNDEFKEIHLRQNEEVTKTDDPIPDDTHYDDIDYTAYFPPARAQGHCGSCWSFGSIASIEANFKLKFGKTLEFSEQELVDCDSSNNGCKGGYEDRAFKYVQDKSL